MANIITKFFRQLHFHAVLKLRFRLRKYVIIFTRCKKGVAASKIQRCYRAHVAWLLWVKEQLELFYQAQRNNATVRRQSVRTIQWYWRKYWRPKWNVRRIVGKDSNGIPIYKLAGWEMKMSRYSRHVLFLFRNVHRERRVKHALMVTRIQNAIRLWLAQRRRTWHLIQLISARKIWVMCRKHLMIVTYSFHRLWLQTDLFT